MRVVDGQQFFWIISLAFIASAIALFVDESVFNIGSHKMKYRDNYYIWVISSMTFVALA